MTYRRDPLCTCPACNPPREPWAERWIVILPVALVALAVVFLTWTGALFG